MNFRLSVIALLSTLCFFPNQIFAKKAARIPPAALYIQINTEPVRESYLKKKGDTNALSKLQIASGNAAQVMINDFTDHFKFCPVYYFYDSNLTRLKEGDYSVLMDANRKPVSSEQIAAVGTNYFLGYFGFTGTANYQQAPSDNPYDPATIQHDKVYGTSYGSAKSTAMASGFVVTNSEHREIPRFFVGRNRDMNIFIGSLRDAKYNYSSSDFMIDYVRSARTLNHLFFDYYVPKK